MDAKEKMFKKMEQTLFLPREDASKVLTPSQLERKERLMLCVSKKMEDPMMADKLLIDFLTSGCEGYCRPVPLSTAYRDVAAITRLFGNIQLASKSWYRYMIVEGAKEAYRIAKEKEDAKGMAAAIDKIGRYTRSDKEDDKFNWELLIPPSFEPSDDPSLLGNDVEKIENLEERRQELRRLFHSGKYVQDAEIIVDDTSQ
ncbi:MAG: hypothetical protein LBC40_05940 [Dysgonamonadaceae bacterium]|jgi:hypothetical protein|nr:hypothetical protein [Dysgonamonadaceae bacterium]